MAGQRKLTVRQAKFVEEYVKDGNGARAAVAAGYSRLYPHAAAWQLLNEQPQVMAAVEAARKTAAVAAQYNAEKAMTEAEKGMSFALETKNANAYVKAVELRAKLQGLLIDRAELRVETLDLNVALEEARVRAVGFIDRDSIEDAELVEEEDIFS